MVIKAQIFFPFSCFLSNIPVSPWMFMLSHSAHLIHLFSILLLVQVPAALLCGSWWKPWPPPVPHLWSRLLLLEPTQADQLQNARYNSLTILPYSLCQTKAAQTSCTIEPRSSWSAAGNIVYLNTPLLLKLILCFPLHWFSPSHSSSINCYCLHQIACY